MDNLARKISYSDDQIDALKKDAGFSTENIKEIQEERARIVQEIELSTELDLKSKLELKRQLTSEVSGTDLSKIQGFRKVMNEKISESLNFQYENRINENRDAFSFDSKRNLDTARQFIDDFKNLSLEKKRQWMQDLDKEITKRINLREQLRQQMPETDPEYFRTLRRSEMEALIKNISTLDEFMETNNKFYSRKEKEEIHQRISDCPKNEQEKIMSETKKTLEARKKMHEIFENLPSEFRAEIRDFEEYNFEQKKHALEQVENSMKKKFQKRLESAKNQNYTSQESADEAYEHFRNAEMLGDFGKIAAWNALDKQIDSEKKLKDEFDKLMGKLKQHLTTDQSASFKHRFSLASYSEKKDKLLVELKDLLNEKNEEADWEKEMTKKYSSSLNSAHQKGYISKSTMELSLKIWNKSDSDYKEETSGNFEELLKPYINAHKEFNEMVLQIKDRELTTPDELAKSMQDFNEGGLIQKIKTIEKLEKIIDEKKDPEQKEDGEETEQTINNLAGKASMAERRRDFQTAMDCYSKILELDPNDAMAKRNADYIEKMSKQTSSPDSKADNKDQKEKASSYVEEIKKNEDVRAKMEENTIKRTLAEEAAGSENSGRSTKALNRSNRSGELEKELTEKLAEDNYMLEKDGTASEVIDVNKDEKLTGANRAKLRQTAYEDIIRSSDTSYMQNIQFHDKSGRLIGANEALNQVDQDEENLKRDITRRALEKSGKTSSSPDTAENLKTILEEKLKNEDLETKLAA